MRRIPRYLFLIAKRYGRWILRRRPDVADLQTVLERAVASLPLQSGIFTKEGALRTAEMNRQLAWCMAFIAGAVNAGGFLAVSHYTSHMTGVVSAMSDTTAAGDLVTTLTALAMLLFFVGGAFVSTTLLSFGKRRDLPSRYAISLLVEAVLLLVFGFMGGRMQDRIRFHLPETVALLCFIMGMHNSITTNISGAAVRTTHLTGTVTDIGIELSKLAYINVDKDPHKERIEANRSKLRLYLLILVSFFIGGVAGALGFRHIGFKVTVPLAGFLCFLAARPVILQVRLVLRALKRNLEDQP